MPDWELCSTQPGAAQTPEELAGLDVEWLAATVPGTAASALRAAGQWTVDDDRDFDAADWWWRSTFVVEASEHTWLLELGGVATIADVWFDGRHVLHSETMFEAHTIDLGDLAPGSHDVSIRCAALAPLLATKRPRPRWKTRLVRHQNLRWFRTTLLGRMPGWFPTGAPVGPWRGCELVPAPAVLASTIRARCEGDDGVVDVTVRLRDAKAVALVSVGDVRSDMSRDGEQARATVHVPSPARWWPHTHGPPTLHDVTVEVGDRSFLLGRVGFRTIDAVTVDGGFALHVNGQPVFCRGASWMPVDAVSLSVDADAQHAALVDVKRANMNMVRLSGVSVYEDNAFFDACDELGILVWQDVMFANMDPPDDPDFVTGVEAEVGQLLDRVGHRPSLAVLCGGSEVEQQAAMLGLARDRWTLPLFEDVIRAIAAREVPGLVYVTSTPTGGALPFHDDAGVAHYFGVGAYRRPVTDARLADVRFATECLAFANAPDGLSGAEAIARYGVVRDNGSDWDFADITDHYVRELFAVDADALRTADPDRYLDLARATTGSLMEATFAEWRRAGSRCAGGLIWLLRDRRGGSGWGVVDASGSPKASWWFARRAMAPVALFALDEGLNGLHLHVVNDGAAALQATMRVELFSRGELLLETGEQAIEVEARCARRYSADALFDGFRDLTWAYRFGPAAYDVIAATLLDGDGSRLGHAFHLPLGLAREREADIGLSATTAPSDDGRWRLTIRAERIVTLEPMHDDDRPPTGHVRAINSIAGCSIDFG
jgi:beta-mannosidase